MSPVDWDSHHWGQPGHNVHIASNGSDVPDRHTASEDACERNH